MYAPEVRGVAADTVRVWLIRSDVGPAVLAGYADALDDHERRRAGDLLHPPHRRRFVAAHGAARQILAGYLAVAPEQIRWRHGDNGKPHLVNGDLQVNLSHSADVAALAITTGRGVGVDLQWCSPNLAAGRLAERYFPAAEARFVAEAATPAEATERFVRLWARKEALVKAAGERITRGLGLPVGGPGRGGDESGAEGLVVSGPCLPGPYRVRDVPAPAGFQAAIALAGPAAFAVSSGWWDAGSSATTSTSASASASTSASASLAG